jgi:hypothetical protein
VTDFNELAQRYIAVWNEPAPDKRARAVVELWSEDATYTDPLAAVAGHDGIAAVITGAREMFPGCVFKLLDRVDGHHDIARFGWALVPEAGGESVVIGFDVAVVGADGRLRAVHGFLDKAPAI